MENPDIIIETFSMPLLKLMKLPIITIYKHPKDYPGKWVARLYNADKATKFIALSDSQEELEKKIPFYMNSLEPSINDDPIISKIYI